MNYHIEDLRNIMAQLRSENGCNWDKQQTFESLVPYAIEEAHEVAEAVNSKNYSHLCEELGDLLLQVVFHAQIAQEQQLFSFDDVVNSISQKMIRRHPHVFAEQTELSPEQVSEQWATIKAQEKQQTVDKTSYLLDQVASGQPALTRAEKLQKTVAKMGFDWNDTRAVILKIREELDEIDLALRETPETVEEELGDLLFCTVNLARHLELDSEQTLKKANNKFTRRFNFIEDQLRQRDKGFKDSDLAEMEHFWQLAKMAELKEEI
ncbi:MAG TPA: nucleoside triphosphate pyrophosphohydrolase [Agitococcus sp.]|nr:nucleoside triphosphate pyrophosphohydrolase [Agitococcus sp.]HNA22636.1 nucleoside triphosphate pyrophosphohydrolase [Agitococcus sp.]HNE91863.1 nucleoside triphosphate pyrophosphohydrolase [Agitococcus sp.]HNI63015.1 nucleoside triphosphate pyrophosphohydrolase [Agitococcus sp.]HNJ87621.1 nucleoside triphosphate pyrophosphohydrolase [Agitococcus sp.]